MISVPFWHLILFILGSVALGGVVVLLAIIVTDKRDGQAATLRPSRGANSARGAVKVTPPRGIEPSLGQRVAQKRSLTIDDAARLLNVPPRRVRRLLDKGPLIVVPGPDGTRRVSAVSVHDLLTRQLATQEESASPIAETGEEKGETGDEDEVGDEDELVPGPTQKYWYYAEGDSRSYRSLREVLQAIGLPYAATGWAELPASARAKLRREKIKQGGDSE